MFKKYIYTNADEHGHRKAVDTVGLDCKKSNKSAFFSKLQTIYIKKRIVMANYTSEQLKKLFAERKRINEEKQQKIKIKLQQLNQILYKEYQKNYRKKQKQLKQEAKYLKIRELQELAKKAAILPQEYKNKNKEVETYTVYKTYNLPTRERETNEEKLYTTWDEIKEAEKKGEGKINWPNLFQLILKVKNKLKTL